jgi:hypothetical protein
MNKNTLIDLINSSEEIEKPAQLDELLRSHPYFQLGHVINWKLKEDSGSLKKASAYTADRAVLAELIREKE